MNSRIKSQLLENGVEVKEALNRFMDNDELYFRFLKMFLKDQSFENLKLALSSGDIKNAYIQAHTLKGVISNLSFYKFQEYLMPLHNSLKEGIIKDYSNELLLLNKQYNILIQIIKEIN